MDRTAASSRHVAGRYDLLRVIDRGGYAIVYEAVDTRLHRTVAIKTLLPDHPDPAASARLLREARVMASITHPNVCGVSDVGTLEDGRPYFVMDRLEGETLRSLLNRELVVEAELAIDFCVELLSALYTVHACGHVHRDLKPENIFLAQRGVCRPSVKLLDFGCCGPMAQREDEVALTRDWHVVGTAAYMAPEQAAGSRLFHAGTDIFAVALVLLEALTGFQPPIRGRQEPIPSLSSFRPDLPAALDAILGRALSPDPRQRYRSTAAFAKDLVAVRPLCREESAPPSVNVVVRESPKVPTTPMFAKSGPPIPREDSDDTNPLPPIRRRAPSYGDTERPVSPILQAAAASRADAVDDNDSTHQIRRSPKPRPRDTLRDYEDETPMAAQQRFPLTLRS